jgi:multicomponent Na+:H+ antiporter subunit E
MVEAARQPAGGIRASCYLFAFLFATWLVLTSSLHWQELLTGALVSVVLSAFLAWTYARLGLPPFSLKRAWYFGVYLLVLLKEIIRANLDVAYRVIHPRLPIKPGIVAIRTELKQDIAKMLLANSITLTPGTFTLDILGDTLLIHWIDVKSEDAEEAARLISGRFEKYLREVFA